MRRWGGANAAGGTEEVVGGLNTSCARTVLALHLAVSAGPSVSLIICWAVYYALGHHPAGEGLVTISETVEEYPECRVFALSMNVWAVLVLIVLRMRYALSGASDTCHVWTLQILSYLSPLALSVLSLVSLRDFGMLHGGAAFVFFNGLIVFQVLSDRVIRKRGGAIPFWSLAVPYAAIGAEVMYMGSMGLGWYAMGSAFQYVLALTLFMKLLFFYWDCPGVRIASCSGVAGAFESLIGDDAA